MKHKYSAIASVLCLSFAAQAFGQQTAVVARGSRILGISVGQAQTQSYADAFVVAKQTGMQSTTLSLNWTDIETSPGVYNNPNLGIANAFYPANNTQLDLILRPINTNYKCVPSDLATKPFDDPLVIARFERLLDYVFSQIPNLLLHSLSIGNEVDAYLAANAGQWNAYQTFYNATSQYARAKRPGLKVGVVGTFNGLTGGSQANMLSLNSMSDYVVVTYYPLNPDFTVMSPTSPVADFDRLVNVYPHRQIVFTEAGYPSSHLCNSSDQMQADFVRGLFHAWDKHAGRIQAITFSWESDLSVKVANDTAKYYGISAPAFVEFLRTLGLRTYPGNGANKPSFTALKADALARGW